MKKCTPRALSSQSLSGQICDVDKKTQKTQVLWRLLSAKDFAQMQNSQKRLVMDFYLQFF